MGAVVTRRMLMGWGLRTCVPSIRGCSVGPCRHGVLSSEVSTPRSLRSWSVVVHRVMPEAQATKKRGIPLTGIDRTLLDLAGVLERHHLEVALDDALNRRLTTLASLESAILSHARKGRPGSGALRPLIKSRRALASVPESALETRFLGLLRAAQLPAPVTQYEIRDGGRFVGRVDFAYPDLRIAIEADGFRHHSNRDAWQRDLQRRNRLTAAGWSILHVTWRDLEQRSHQLVHELRQILSFPGAG